MGTRHERVVVDLDDRFSRNAAGMAAATSMFRRNLGDADRQLLTFDKHTQDVGRNIDKLSGRLGLFVDLAATLGPALIPTTTALLPILTGLTNQLGFAAIAGGSTILAFQGVGDALKAVNEQAVNPSTENLEKMNEAMAKLGPAGRDFVRELQAIRPEMQKLQDAAQAGLFPGMTEGIQSLMTRMPEAERIIGDISDTVGDLLSRAGDSLAGPEWDQFFQTLESEGRPTLEALGESIGQVTKGLAELWIAFAPLNRDFSQGMLDASRSFAEWADGLSQTQGFADFMAYLEETGPQVRETLAALGGALLDVLEAAAPLGGPALAAIKGFSEAISAIANSDIGPPLLAAVAAMRAFSLASTVASKTTSTAWGAKAQAQAKSYGGSLLGVVSAQERANTAAGNMARSTAMQRTAMLRGAAGVAALTVATTGVADSFGLANTSMMGLTGFMVGGPLGAAIGAGVGGFLDLKATGDALTDSINKLNAAAAAGNWDAVAAGISKVNKALADPDEHTGVGDYVSDIASKFKAAIPGGDTSLTGDRGSVHSVKADAALFASAWMTAYDSTSRSAAATTAANKLAADGFRMTGAGAREAAMSMDEFAFSMNSATEALQRQSNWDSFRGSILDAKDAVAEAGKTLKANGDIIRGQGREMQRAGLESRGLLRNIAAQAVQTSEGMKDVGKRTKFLDSARDSFIKVARSMGLSRSAARSLADSLGLVDRVFTPRVIEKGSKESKARVKALRTEIQNTKDRMVHMDEKGAADARRRIAGLRAEIARLQGKTIYINTIEKRRVEATGSSHPGAGADKGTNPDKGARGMLFHGGVRHYAYGDVANRHMPELAGPGMTRVWREPETMGEAYIPLADDDRRPRARAIAAETVSLLGGTAYFANGGINDGSRRRRGGDNDGHHVDRFTKAIRAATAAINREKTARESLISRRSELAGTVRDQFLSDPFAAGDVWKAGAGDPRNILKADIAKANAFKKSLIMLKQRGLDGQALAAIASTGDVGKAQALLGLGRAGIGQYETLYGQRAAAAASVGNYAGGAVYNPQIAATNKEIRALRAEIVHLRRESKGHAKDTGREVAKGVNKGAASAKRGRR